MPASVTSSTAGCGENLHFPRSGTRLRPNPLLVCAPQTAGPFNPVP